MKLRNLCFALTILVSSNGFAQNTKGQTASAKGSEQLAKSAVEPKNAPKVKVTPKLCRQTARKVERHVRRCIKSPQFAKRKACIESVSGLAPSEVFEGCQRQMQNVKRRMTNLEKRLHKGKRLAFAERNKRNRERDRNRGPRVSNRIDPRVCRSAGKRVENHVRRCLRSKDFARRKACVNSVSDLAPSKVFEGCRGTFEPLKRKMTAYERKLHPKQRLAMVDETRSKNPYGREMKRNGGRKISRVMCNKVARGVKARGNGCLRKRNFNSRKRCFQNLGKYIDRRVGEKCNYLIDPMGQNFIAQEKQRYKGQSALAAVMGNHHDHIGGDHEKADKQGHTVRQCERIAKMAQRRGVRCLSKRRYNVRKRCVDSIRKGLKRRIGNKGCDEFLDPIGRNLWSMERKRYPNQRTAFHGPDRQRNEAPKKQVASDKPKHEKMCQNLAKRVERLGRGCMPHRKLARRKGCFKRIERFIERRGGNKCEYLLDPIGQKMVEMEKSRYKGQSALAAIMGSDTHAGHLNKDHHAVDKSGHSVAQCKAVARMAEKRANVCLSKRRRAVRKRCMDAVGRSIDRRVGRGCDAVMDPLGDKIAALEKRRYPNQQPTLGEGSQGPAPKVASRKMTPQQAAEMQRNMVKKATGAQRKKICAFATKTISRRADSCIRRVRRHQRAACTANIGRYIDHKGWGEVCSNELAVLKDNYRSKEKQRYPSQEGTLE